MATDEPSSRGADGGKIITASPLDYHIFRQEITSKYPAYTPQAPLLPLEPDNNSILPPLANRSSRANGSNGILPPPMNVNSSGASILHQPVHIATPAPSPPPSPPVGGKAGKKQNYQTNQNFPFMYPPLDSTSNSAGGKGPAGLQGLLVGRRWEGSDIPKSILEAGELFAKRMRMTRAMRQLWDERERFLKFERGWEDGDDEEIEELDLEQLLQKKLTIDDDGKPKHVPHEVDYGPHVDIDSNTKAKLDIVEELYVSHQIMQPWNFYSLSTEKSTSRPSIFGHSTAQGGLGQRYSAHHPAHGSAPKWPWTRLQVRDQPAVQQCWPE